LTQTFLPVAVSGGGIVAGCAAKLMAHRGHEVLWAGPKEAPKRADGADQRAYALGPQAIGLLMELGLWQALENKAQPIVSMEIRQSNDRPSGPQTQQADLTLDARELGKENLAWIVSHAELLAAVESPASWPANLNRLETMLRQVTPGGASPCAPAELSLANGQSYKAGLVLAADGQRSAMRRRLGLGWAFGSTHKPRLYADLKASARINPLPCNGFNKGPYSRFYL
jgi:2-polyprenyl-6-methoxyphenol hydroxylase-like FAD-dependent oxidoreductase